MKKALLLVTLLSLLLIGADQVRLVRLTIVNKSGEKIDIQLTGQEPENFYYLRIPAGDRQFPTTKVFTIVPHTYSMQPIYHQFWDPVYGYRLGNIPPSTLCATRNIRITFLEPNWTSWWIGEPTQIKYSPRWQYIY